MSEHVFRANATWSGGDAGQGIAVSPGMAAVAVSLRAQFGGTVAGSNPEELFLSALASCLAMTTAFMLDGRDIPFEAIHVEAKGTVVRGPTRFDRFDIKLRVAMPASANVEMRERALALAARADEKCMMSRLAFRTASTFEMRAALE